MDNQVQSPIVSKKIIHVDMDAFFASVEQHDFPELRGKPIAVGGSKERGVVAAASYEARKYGVKSAISSAIAARLCPDLIFVNPRFGRYKEVSSQIGEIFYRHTGLVEPLSLDEAYLDVTESAPTLDHAIAIASEIKEQILKETSLTVSAGVSYNKFLAKTASDLNKPNGLSVITEAEADDFLRKLPVGRFFGIGQATAEKMKRAGIFTGADLQKKSKEDLILRFGKSGGYYYHICRGIDPRPVVPNRERKSISVENTFDRNLTDIDDAREALDEIIQTLFGRYQRSGVPAKGVTLKLKYADFRQITRSDTSHEPIKTVDELASIAHGLLREELLKDTGVRLLGLTIHHFANDEPATETQLRLKF